MDRNLLFSGKVTSWAFTATGTERENFVHARYECVMSRYPYFWNGLIEVSPEVKQRLTEKHRAHLMEMFGFSV